jgi:hypothetical protein
MYFAWNWEFGSVLSKLQNFGTPVGCAFLSSVHWFNTARSSHGKVAAGTLWGRLPAVQPTYRLILKPHENRGVLILCLDSWRERPWSIYTLHRQKVLKEDFVCLA